MSYQPFDERLSAPPKKRPVIDFAKNLVGKSDRTQSLVETIPGVNPFIKDQGNNPAISNLPLHLNLDAIKKKRKKESLTKNCEICEAPFKKLGIRHCKMCALAVCEACSDQRKQIS